jgi:hypothetical protein
MKKYVSLMLVLMTIFTLVSCSGETEESSAPPDLVFRFTVE